MLFTNDTYTIVVAANYPPANAQSLPKPTGAYGTADLTISRSSVSTD